MQKFSSANNCNQSVRVKRYYYFQYLLVVIQVDLRELNSAAFILSNQLTDGWLIKVIVIAYVLVVTETVEMGPFTLFVLVCLYFEIWVCLYKILLRDLFILLLSVDNTL